MSNYEQLPNKVYNGFNAIYTKDGKSIGGFDPLDTVK